MLAKQAARRWKRTALVTDFDNSYFRPDGIADTQKLAALTRRHTIPTVIVTGNSFEGLMDTINRHGLPHPEVIVSSVGTKIHVLTPRPDGTTVYVRDERFDTLMRRRPFNRKALGKRSVKLMNTDDGRWWDLVFQLPSQEWNFLQGTAPAPEKYKLSFYAMAYDTSRDRLEAWAKQAFPGTCVVVCEEIGYNGRHAAEIAAGARRRYCIDLLPIDPKSTAVNYVVETLSIERALNCGDSGNDAKLLTETSIGFGVIAGGNKPELVRKVIGKTGQRYAIRNLWTVAQRDTTGKIVKNRRVFFDPNAKTKAAGTIMDATRTWIGLLSWFEPDPGVRAEFASIIGELQPTGAPMPAAV